MTRQAGLQRQGIKLPYSGDDCFLVVNRELSQKEGSRGEFIDNFKTYFELQRNTKALEENSQKIPELCKNYQVKIILSQREV